jgi:hypothetical protein
VPVVEKRREQWSLQRYPAAALGQRKRRVFMAQELRQNSVRVDHTFGGCTLFEPQSDRQRVDEHPKHTFGAGSSL